MAALSSFSSSCESRIISSLTGFSAGADDYISKPFSLHEVLARIKAVLRRTKTEPERTELHVGSMTIDFVKKLVKTNGEDN